MSKRKFDESLHSSIADDVVVAVDGGGAEYYEEHQSSTSDDNLLVHRRLAKKARCHTLNDEEATTSKQIKQQLNYATPNDETSAIGTITDDKTPVSSSLNKFQQPLNRKRVSFGAVSIYYFQRSQGFSCVPTSGGSTLGMSRKHHLSRILSLTEHLEEVKRQRQLCVEEQRRPVERPEEEEENDHQRNQNQQLDANNQQHYEEEVTNNSEDFEDEDVNEYDDEFEENEETVDEEYHVQSSVSNEYFVETPNDSSTTMPDDYYLQPLDSKQRRSILRAIGVQVDRDEREECQSIRVSRQSCGCNCRGQCLPESCACALEQIKCQVDRPTFPCSCTKNNCFNPFGRVEFNAVRVRTHYLHTMMRLRIENKQQACLPSSTHIRFDGGDVDNNGYIDQDVQHDLTESTTTTIPTTNNHHMNNGVCSTSSSSMIPAFHHTFSTSTSSSLESTNNFWPLVAESNNCRSNGASAYLSSLNDIEASQQPLYTNGYHQDHERNTANLVGKISADEHFFNTEDENEDDNDEEEDEDEDEDDSVITTMRDRSSSFCLKSTSSEPTYTLAALYPHQNHHYSNGGNGTRSHSFNEFLDPLYFPTFALATECLCGVQGRRCDCSSDDDEGESSSSSSSSSSSMMVAADKMIMIKNNNHHHLDDDSCSNERVVSRENGINTAASAYLPSSPAELSAVLKKSICETVLA